LSGKCEAPELLSGDCQNLQTVKSLKVYSCDWLVLETLAGAWEPQFQHSLVVQENASVFMYGAPTEHPAREICRVHENMSGEWQALESLSGDLQTRFGDGQYLQTVVTLKHCPVTVNILKQ